MLLCCTAAAPDEAVEANLKVVGRFELTAPVAYAEVTVVSTTAIVASHGPESPCAGASATVLDVKDPRRPRVAATIPVPAGLTVADLDSATLLTPAFTGDVLAVALVPCASGRSPSIALYNVTEPAAPVLLAETAGGTSVSLAQRADGRALAVRVAGAGLAVDEITDPAHPVALATWQDPATPAAPCGLGTAQAYDGGEGAVAVLPGGRLFDVDLREPSQPFSPGAAEAAGGQVAVLPLGNRTIAVVAPDDECPGDPALRVFTLERAKEPQEDAPVRYPGAGAPVRLVGSGTLGYVAWHGAGLRVVDFAEVRPRTVAQFVPAGADVVGVGLLPQHVVVSDANQGVFVLERPDEGGGRATFWSQFLGLLPYLGFAGVMAAAFLVPRVLASRAGATVRMPVPGAEPVRRRRA